MERVLVVGGAGWGNVGDDLISRNIVRRELVRGCSVTVVGGPLPISGLPAGVRHINIGGNLRARTRLVAEIARSNRVLIGGGGLLDDRLPNFYRPFLRVATTARYLRRPFHLVAVGVGPIRRPDTARAYRRIFDTAQSSTVRDEASQIRAVSTGTSRPPNVQDDPALWVNPAEAGPAHCQARYDLVVNLRCWELGEMPGEPAARDTNAIVEAVAEALNFNPPDRVALVSMSKLDGDDDSEALESLASRLTFPVDRFYGGSLDEVERVIACADAVLSMRLHLSLMAVVQNVPQIVGLAYDLKVCQQAERHAFLAVPIDDEFSSSALLQVMAVR